ncbi:MAG: iron ABC transporter permease [Chloroflexota bacterium]
MSYATGTTSRDASTDRPLMHRAIVPSGLLPLTLLLIILLVASITFAVAIGPVPITLGMVWRIALHHIFPFGIVPDWQPFQADIVWEIRFPRVLLAACVGAGLAVVGAAMQALVRNPLADPYILGISSGASVGAVIVMLLGLNLFGIYSRSFAAFLGAFGAFMLVFLLARQHGRVTTSRLILSGVAISYILSALTSFLVYNAEESEEVRSVIFWLLGGFSGARWSYLAVPVCVLLGGIVWLTINSRALNALIAGEETAVSLGIDVQRFRIAIFAVTSLLTGVLVAVSGGIGFVGLMLPHTARLVVGTDHRRLLPIVALSGAIFLVWVDVLARIIVAPAELPIGIITALLGGPFFIWLMRRRGSGKPHID